MRAFGGVEIVPARSRRCAGVTKTTLCAGCAGSKLHQRCRRDAQLRGCVAQLRRFHKNDRIDNRGGNHAVGYTRVSRAIGSQTTDLQREVLLFAGVDEDCSYDDRASGKKDDRPQLAVCLKALPRRDTRLLGKFEPLGLD